MAPGSTIAIEVRRGRDFSVGTWYTIAKGNDGRTLDVRCVGVDGNVVTFLAPQVAEA